jgi:hypothetical protein
MTRLLAFALLLIPLEGCVPSASNARAQAAKDMGCPEEKIDVTEHGDSYRAEGCGQNAQYRCIREAPMLAGDGIPPRSPAFAKGRCTSRL